MASRRFMLLKARGWCALHRVTRPDDGPVNPGWGPCPVSGSRNLDHGLQARRRCGPHAKVAVVQRRAFGRIQVQASGSLDVDIGYRLSALDLINADNDVDAFERAGLTGFHPARSVMPLVATARGRLRLSRASRKARTPGLTGISSRIRPTRGRIHAPIQYRRRLQPSHAGRCGSQDVPGTDDHSHAEPIRHPHHGHSDFLGLPSFRQCPMLTEDMQTAASMLH